MQNNSITLRDLPTGSILKEYTRHEETLNRSTYIGSDHTLASRDTLQLYRTPAKRAGQYLGSAKSSVKATYDVAVPNADGSGNVTSPVIMELSASVPVGTNDADRALVLNTLMAFFFNSSGSEFTSDGSSLQSILEI